MNTESIPNPATAAPAFAAFVAIDWADQKHVWALQAADSTRIEQGEIAHTPEAVEAWAVELTARFAGRPIAVALEQSRGALLFMLTKYDQLVLYPVHAASLAQYRAAFYPSGAKDDPSDARLLLDLLLHHRDRLRRLEPDSVETRTLQFLVEERRKLVNEKTRQSNRLTATLKLYFPQLLDWFEEVDSLLVGALLRRWPTLEQLQKEPPATLRQFFYQHNCRSAERIEQRLEQIRQTIPATRDAAVLQASVAAVGVLVELIGVLRRGIAELDRQIAELFAAHPDFALFDSLPGAGPVLAPRLLAALGSRRERYTSAEEIQCYSGIAPVVERSGTARWIHCRGAVRSFSGKRFTNGPCTRSVRRNGRACTIRRSARRESRITPPSAHWPSSGFASSTAAGRTGPPITNRRTRSHCADGSLRSRLGQLTPWQPRASPSCGKTVQASRNWCSQPLDWSTSDDW